jgi:hypothetical protein
MGQRGNWHPSCILFMAHQPQKNREIAMNANPFSEAAPPTESVTGTSKFVLVSLFVFVLLMGAITLGDLVGAIYR